MENVKNVKSKVEEKNSESKFCFVKQSVPMLIRFYSYNDKIPTGEVKNICCKKVFPFSGLDQMLLIIEEIMNDIGYPQAEWGSRSLLEGKGKRFYFIDEKMSIDLKNGSYKSDQKKPYIQIIIRVYRRQRGSMQGEIYNNKYGVKFRSCLELIRILHEMLSQENVFKK